MEKVKKEFTQEEIGALQQFLGLAAKHPDCTLTMQVGCMELVKRLGTPPPEEPKEEKSE